MAYYSIQLKHPSTGESKTSPVGFSWTTLFFGILVPLWRGHFVGFAYMVVAALCTGGLSRFVFAFVYNKQYLRYLIYEKGFREISEVHYTSSLDEDRWTY